MHRTTAALVAAAVGVTLLGTPAGAATTTTPTGVTATATDGVEFIGKGKRYRDPDEPRSVARPGARPDVNAVDDHDQAQINKRKRTYSGDFSIAAPYCEPGWYARVTDNITNTRYVTHVDEVSNPSRATVTMTTTVSTTHTRYYGVSAEVSAAAKGAFFTEVKGTIRGEISKSKTMYAGTSLSVNVPAYSTFRTQYGAKKERVDGYMRYVYSNCNLGQRNYSGFRAPYTKRWWVSEL